MSINLDPIHPGEILIEDFLKPLGISINKVARDIDVPPGRISTIVNGKRSITADTALRLGLYFGVSPETLAESSNGLRIEDCPAGNRAAYSSFETGVITSHPGAVPPSTGPRG